jgi:hypothetical protein
VKELVFHLPKNVFGFELNKEAVYFSPRKGTQEILRSPCILTSRNS